MNGDHLKFDCESGNVDLEEFTDEDRAQREADQAVALERQAIEDARASTEGQIRQQIVDHLADLRAITGSSGSLTNAQMSNAVRALARGQIRLIRLAVGLLDGVD